MPRIRTIKPEFPQSESMGRVSRDARLTFILLWTIADDAGRLRGNSRMLASLLFPYDEDAPKHIDKWLDELSREKCIIRYRVNGDHYMEICNWLSHQKIDKPSKSKIAPFDNTLEDSSSPRECSSLDQGSRIKEWNGIGSKEASRVSAKPTLEQVFEYCQERSNGIDPGKFFDFYTANGWVQGRGKPIKDWRAAVRTWEGKSAPSSRAGQPLTSEELETYNPVDGGGE